MWTKEEITALKENYNKLEESSLAQLLKKSPNAIRIKASRLGLNKLKARELIVLTKEEEQIIIGGLLGDLYCRIKKTSKNANIEGAHCKKQESYLLWKISLLKSLSFNLRRTNLGYLFFESRAFHCLNLYRNLFYKNGKKEVNKDILDKLEPLGLAIWYMDDGTYSKKDRNSSIFTNGFTYEENILIKEWFESKWKLFPKVYATRNPKKYPNKVWHYLNFSVSETVKLINIIRDYIHPSMKYKIGVN